MPRPDTPGLVVNGAADLIATASVAVCRVGALRLGPAVHGQVCRRQGVTMQVRSKAEIARLVDGLDLVESGLEVITRCRPE
jgi:hypothetical protein